MSLQTASQLGVRRVLGAATRPLTGQQRARHNALVACTTLAARRAELREVEDFLADLSREREEVSSARPA